MLHPLGRDGPAKPAQFEFPAPPRSGCPGPTNEIESIVPDGAQLLVSLLELVVPSFRNVLTPSAAAACPLDPAGLFRTGRTRGCTARIALLRARTRHPCVWRTYSRIYRIRPGPSPSWSWAAWRPGGSTWRLSVCETDWPEGREHNCSGLASACTRPATSLRPRSGHASTDAPQARPVLPRRWVARCGTRGPVRFFS